MELHTLLGVKTPEDIRMMKIQYFRIDHFASLSEGTQTDLCCLRNVLSAGLQTTLGG